MDLVTDAFNVLPLTEAVARLRRKSLPARAVCITFDDGYANNLTVALPILKARKLPATVFVSTGFVGGARMWNDTVIEAVRFAPRQLDLEPMGLGKYVLGSTDERRAAITALIDRLKYKPPEERLMRVDDIARVVHLAPAHDVMMSDSQLRTLSAAGVEIGGHTVSHPILTRLSDDQARAEIANGRQQLQEIIDAPVSLFAYPNGRPGQDYEQRHVKLVQSCGFDAAVSTSWGACRADTDIYQMPRVAPWDQTPARFAARLASAYLSKVAAVA